MTTPDRLPEFIHRVCQTDRYGGRCIRTGAGTWEINDIAQWTEEQNTALRSQYPRIEAKVVANRKSLSGFSVMLRAHKVSHAWVSLLLCAAMIASITALSRTLWLKTH